MKTIYQSIFKPKEIINQLNNKSKKYIWILFLAPLILVIPYLLVTIIDSDKLFYNVEDYYQMLVNIEFPDYEITDYRLEILDERLYTSADVNITIGHKELGLSKYDLVFEEDKIAFYMAQVLFSSKTYEELALNNLSLNKQSDKMIIANAIYEVVNSNKIYYVYELLVIAVSYIFDYIMIVLLISLLSFVLTPIKIPFKLRFKLSTYLTLPYLLITFIFILLNISLMYLPILVVYFYHWYVYKGLAVAKVVKKE